MALADAPACELLLPDKSGFSKVDDLKDEHKLHLEELIIQAKAQMNPNNPTLPTEKEKQLFYELIFHFWTSHDLHCLPDNSITTAGKNDKTIPVGILLQDYPTDRDVQQFQKNSGHNTKITKKRAFRHLQSDMHVAVDTHPTRKRGARVSMRVELYNKNSVSKNNFYLIY